MDLALEKNRHFGYRQRKCVYRNVVKSAIERERERRAKASRRDAILRTASETKYTRKEEQVRKTGGDKAALQKNSPYFVLLLLRIACCHFQISFYVVAGSRIWRPTAVSIISLLFFMRRIDNLRSKIDLSYPEVVVDGKHSATFGNSQYVVWLSRNCYRSCLTVA